MKRGAYRVMPDLVVERLGFPAGTTVVGAEWDASTQTVLLHLTHDSLPDVREGNVAPTCLIRPATWSIG